MVLQKAREKKLTIEKRLYLVMALLHVTIQLLILFTKADLSKAGLMEKVIMLLILIFRH